MSSLRSVKTSSARSFSDTVRKYRLATFCIGSALVGLSGALYTAWGQFITPASVGLPAAAMPIVWVSFSGRRELTATLVGTFLFLYAYQLITGTASSLPWC